MRDYLNKHTPYCEVFIDQLIPKGEKWQEQIDKSLKDCHIFIVFLTNSAIQSIPIKKEVKIAKEKRRDEVYRLHFELGYSARKISEMMKVNRNTINADVRFWYETLGKSFEKNEIKGCIIKQLTRYENQISRLTEKLESCQDLELELNIEKLIAEINNKTSSLYLKILENHTEPQTVEENEISQLARKLSALQIINPIKESELLTLVIKLQRCKIQQAELMIENLNQFGLSQFLQSGYHNFKEFSAMRGYLSDKESKYLDDLLVQYVSCNSDCILEKSMIQEKSNIVKKIREFT